MLKNSASKVLTLVWHGTVLDGSVEQDNISRLPGHLDHVGKEIINIIGVSGFDVGPGSDSGSSVLLCEVGEQVDKLKG